MSLFRWSIGVLFLGAILFALGVLPELIAAAVNAESAFTFMLMLSVAPLGALTLAIGVVLFAVAAIRRVVSRG